MGHWGHGLEDSDQVQDYQHEIEEELRNGKTIYDVSYYCEDTLLALASWQASTGKISSQLKQIALAQIDEEIKEIDNGTSGWSEPEKREDVLFQLQGEISDALETKINVEKKMTEYLFSGMNLQETNEKIMLEIDDEAEADILDLAKLQLKSGNVDEEIKIKALYILERQLKRIRYRFHLYAAIENYETLKKELEKA